MALTRPFSDQTTIDTSGSTLATVTGPGVFSAAFDLSHFDGCDVQLMWLLGFEAVGHNPPVWVVDYAVDLATLQSGLLSPPMPVMATAALRATLVTGTPDGDLAWEVYQL